MVMMVMMVIMMMIIIIMIMFDDDADDDDDDVERTRTGPYAVRSDVEHLVNHNAKIYTFV